MIEVYKKNNAVIKEVQNINSENVIISQVSCAELIYGARDKAELNLILKDLSFLKTLLLTSDISNLGLELMSKFSLSHHLNFPDSLIAATSILHNLRIYTLNIKDFHYLPGINLYK